jgi:hypothetical protein
VLDGYPELTLGDRAGEIPASCDTAATR